MTTMEDPSHTRAEIRERYEDSDDVPTDGHANYGDVNPGPHGGVWVIYDNGEWDVTETVISSEVGFDDAGFEDVGDQYVMQSGVQWRDLVTEDGEWTDHASQFVDTFHNSHASPMGAVVDGRMTAYAAWYATDYSNGRSKRVQMDDYEAVLDSFGIEPIDD